MAGQTIQDRLLAARHSLAGQGLAKSVCKATTEELIGPKKKHLDYLIHCTNEPNVSIPQLANLLIERSQNASWVVVFKSLITVHHLMCYGNERFTQYLASSNSSFQLSNFLDKSSLQGSSDLNNKKVLTGDLDSSLASLAENLTINKAAQPTQVQWNSPKNTPKPGSGQPGMGWSPQPMAATTGANYRPMGQGMMSNPSPFVSSYGQMGVQPSSVGGSAVGGGNPGVAASSSAQTSQPQPVMDPFGL